MKQTVGVEVPQYHTYLTDLYEHNTYLSGGLVLWSFMCFDPGTTLTTAPTASQVSQVLWKEVRTQWADNPYIQPKTPYMGTDAAHFALGYTAANAESFQGRHNKHMLILFDEATGILAPFWDAASGMMLSEGRYMLAIFNPTNISSRVYQEYKGGKWDVVRISALDHPNILAELQGLPPVFPGAVQLQWVDDMVRGADPWCTPISASEATVNDFLYPPPGNKAFPDNEENHPRWYRPGPLFESRVLGLFPTQGSNSVWTEMMWENALVQQPIPDEPVEIGCDVAREGSDNTSFIIRRGSAVLDHETYNGWLTDRTERHLKDLCAHWGGQIGMQPTSVRCKIDDDGVGGGVVDQKKGYNFVPVRASSNARDGKKYFKRRSELWFHTAALAAKGGVDLSRLSKESKDILEKQLKAPEWTLDDHGRRVVERKVVTKKRIGRSPDDADALNLAFADSHASSFRLSSANIARSAGHIALPDDLPGTAFERRNPRARSYDGYRDYEDEMGYSGIISGESLGIF
jgi:hypothetical protein